jgi:hypothetical protein
MVCLKNSVDEIWLVLITNSPAVATRPLAPILLEKSESKQQTQVIRFEETKTRNWRKSLLFLVSRRKGSQNALAQVAGLTQWHSGSAPTSADIRVRKVG